MQNFAEFFDRKVVGIVELTRLDQGAYNGRWKIYAGDWMVMTRERITECIKTLKFKNIKGYKNWVKLFSKQATSH